MNPFQDVFDRQKRHFATTLTRSYLWRVEQLDRMARLVEENEPALQRAVSEDFKTASQEQVFETLACRGEVAFQKSQLHDWMAPTEAPVPRALPATGHRGLVYRDPYGVALIVGPFNGPLLLLLRPAIAALAAGNCCVLKLSEKLNSTSELLLDLLPKYFEPEAVAAVAGDREEVTELLKLPFDFIFFTGSTSVGKVIARAAAENLTPVVLELGGQNPALVDETANIPDAAKKIVWGAMAWGGQWCTSPGYAYVHESVAENFVAEAKAALFALYGEDPKFNPDYSRIINAREVSRLAALIDPAKVVAGVRSDPDARYLDPTILHPVNWEDRIMEEEVFGPILPILTYRTMDEALGKIAATPRPLAAFIFSRDQRAINRFTGELYFGRGAVNQVNILRNAGLRAGALVAIQGVGGLGHLGIQYARRMGYRTAAIGLGPESEKLAKELGAHQYIDSRAEDAGVKLRALGGADAILATAPSGKAMPGLVDGLAARGKLLVIGLAPDPLEVNSGSLVFGMRSISGSTTGSVQDEQETVEFSLLENVEPMIEVMPLSKAREAYDRMMAAKARFRVVLSMNGSSASN